MIGFFEHQFLKYKKAHVRNLVALATIDGHLHSSELKLLRKIGLKYGLKPRQIDSIIENRDKWEVVLPEHPEESIDQMYDLILMVYADGVVDEKELEFFHHMVHGMGFKEGLVEKILELFDKGIPNPIDWEDFKSMALSQYRA
jgi:hypothetical protein